ncbi:hypothetical protein P9112_011581 [Eukaryota sp. TZLM1-RC]
MPIHCISISGHQHQLDLPSSCSVRCYSVSTLCFFQFPSPSFTSCPLLIHLSQQFSLPLSLSVLTGPNQMLVALHLERKEEN